jgi:glycine oxidase
MTVKPDTLVIGGGVIGLLCARELTMRGHSVVVLERNKGAGQESSWAGGGILSPLYPWRYPRAVNDLAIIGHKDYPRLTEALKKSTGIDPEYVRSGHLILDTDEYAEAKIWAEDFTKSITLDENVQFLSRIGYQQMHQLEPELSEQYNQALWLPAIAQVRNPRLIQALLKDLILRGVKIITGASVENILSEHGRVVAIETSKGTYSADKYLVAAGAWTAKLLEKTGVSISVEPVRGQMILFKTDPGRVRRIVMSNGRYLIPRTDGHVLAGSTLEYVGFDKHTTESGYQELVRAAVEIIPFLRNAPVVKHWAGLRPGSTTGVPYIDTHPELENLVVCSGQFRNGIIIGLASARLASSIITGEKPKLSRRPYLIA